MLLPSDLLFKDCFSSHTHWHQAWPEQDWYTFSTELEIHKFLYDAQLWSPSKVLNTWKVRVVLDLFPFLRPVQVSENNQALQVVQIFESTFKHTLWPGLISICYHSQPSRCKEREGSGTEGERSALAPWKTPSPSKTLVLLSNAETAITKAAFECSNIALPTHTHTHTYTLYE